MLAAQVRLKKVLAEMGEDKAFQQEDEIFFLHLISHSIFEIENMVKTMYAHEPKAQCATFREEIEKAQLYSPVTILQKEVDYLRSRVEEYEKEERLRSAD